MHSFRACRKRVYIQKVCVIDMYTTIHHVCVRCTRKDHTSMARQNIHIHINIYFIYI